MELHYFDNDTEIISDKIEVFLKYENGLNSGCEYRKRTPASDNEVELFLDFLEAVKCLHGNSSTVYCADECETDFNGVVIHTYGFFIVLKDSLKDSIEKFVSTEYAKGVVDVYKKILIPLRKKSIEFYKDLLSLCKDISRE